MTGAANFWRRAEIDTSAVTSSKKLYEHQCISGIMHSGDMALLDVESREWDISFSPGEMFMRLILDIR